MHNLWQHKHLSGARHVMLMLVLLYRYDSCATWHLSTVTNVGKYVKLSVMVITIKAQLKHPKEYSLYVQYMYPCKINKNNLLQLSTTVVA